MSEQLFSLGNVSRRSHAKAEARQLFPELPALLNEINTVLAA